MFQSDETGRQNKQREEDYEKMFPKMGRDFVHIDDLNDWLNKLRLILTPLGIVLPPFDKAKAVSKATEYKNNIENGEEGNYVDLVKIDEELEE